MSAVIEIDECPNILDTREMSVPEAKSRDALA